MGLGEAIDRLGTLRFPAVLLVLLLLTGAHLYLFPTGSLLFVIVVFLHVFGGVVMTAWLVRLLSRNFVNYSLPARTGWLFLSVGAGLGIALIFTGTPRSYVPWLYAHIGLCLLGLVVLCSAEARGKPGAARATLILRMGALMLAVGVGAVAAVGFRALSYEGSVIANPDLPPASMDAEGGGPGGLFFPSSAETSTDGYVPADFFMESQKCQRCHEDVYDQWFSSAHHFSSFNNQWYRKSVEYMQEAVGPGPSKWCAGCHDPALLFTGLMDTPVEEILDRPESHAGLGCVMCHSISVKSTMGQGDYTIEYPPMYRLATSENPIVRTLHDFVVKVSPEPHRRTFMKPFVREQTAELCSACHKVHLDSPVNNYRWIRGFNDYDNWQASGVSGEGARSFYYPAEPQTCTDCHMPMIASLDAGNQGGRVHSHGFPAANTALPVANRDPAQLDAAEQFLTNDIVSVDIFAVSRARPREIVAGGLRTGDLSTTFAVGEEADLGRTVGFPETSSPVTAPIDRTQSRVGRGESLRVDVVVRTRQVGHFFPAGTVDAFDVWVELVGKDDSGKVVFWSGMVEDEGRGPVERGAHFYRSLSLDAHGNPIDKRNAWAARAVVYVNLIPPGAADTVHFRLEIPEDAGPEIHLEAKVHYRKFAWSNTRFSYAGIRESGSGGLTADYDDGTWRFDGDTADVSGELKEIPELPIVTLAQDRVTLRVVDAEAVVPEEEIVIDRADWKRWNDYGIGLLLQGDLKGAEAAFGRATEADPENVDGWVNIGRVRVREGNLEGAREVLERALAMEPDLARAKFFFARVLRDEGNFDEALEHLDRVTAGYPRDRVVWNEIGRIRFLQRRYEDAVVALKRVLEIDPEDLMAHYNLMLSYSGLNDEDRAVEHQQFYLRFKADESAQAITGPYLREHPEDNLERQPIHEHGSVPLPEPSQPPATTELATSTNDGGRR